MNGGDQRRGLVGIATDHPVVMVSLTGAFAYFVAALAQRSFYSNFGLEPEDVGLTYTETLGRAAAGLLLLVFFAMIVGLTMYGAMSVYTASRRGEGDETSTPPMRLRTVGPCRPGLRGGP